MSTHSILTSVSELKQGDIFSFRTIKRPIWWRFVQNEEGIILYEEIKSGFRHTSTFRNQTVLKRIE